MAEWKEEEIEIRTAEAELSNLRDQLYTTGRTPTRRSGGAWTQLSRSKTVIKARLIQKIKGFRRALLEVITTEFQLESLLYSTGKPPPMLLGCANAMLVEFLEDTPVATSESDHPK